MACSGLCASSSRSEWEKLANGTSKLRVSLFGLYDDFRDAPILGSLIDPLRSPVAKLVQWETLSGTMKMAMERKRSHEEQEAGVVAQGLAKAAQLLAAKYHWVITNVPYLARGKQTDKLKKFCERRYPAAKNDIATVFLERCLEFCKGGRGFQPLDDQRQDATHSSRGFQPLENQRQDAAATIGAGTISLVLPQNWLFLSTYKKFREQLLRNNTWRMIARLGPGAFETISGEVVKAILLILSRGNKVEEASSLFTKRQDAAATIRRIDVSVPRTAKEKAELLVKAEIQDISQERQLENPDARIASGIDV
ncbi:MAG: SAM-dependent DNA methyltransferase, partial [Thermodesulfobacteriota bacterium]|nr:SAM-dependent DNA methyltransferase [Thermodesulfobacteriota bacterium]